MVNKGERVDPSKLAEIVITVKDGKSAQLVNLGMPTTTATDADDKALFNNGLFDGVCLLEFAARRRFTLVVLFFNCVRHTNNWFFDKLPLDKALIFNGYLFGPWDIAKYNELMPKAPERDCVC
ncbi:Putative protein of unknown function [Podospora comata]|uniref:Uncharacterized protein n=1 Tax=Podospora comata TaxID=48703 RepID=A0ABY6SMX6_PODCO|nr:Putative protein of unknown function [Podospora comata]